MTPEQNKFPIKSFAGLKRAITVGTKLYVVDHWRADQKAVIRNITKTQGNGCWYTIEGDLRRRWMDYPPRAEHLSFPAPNRFRVTVGEAFWELEFVDPEALNRGEIAP